MCTYTRCRHHAATPPHSRFPACAHHIHSRRWLYIRRRSATTSIFALAFTDVFLGCSRVSDNPRLFFCLAAPSFANAHPDPVLKLDLPGFLRAPLNLITWRASHALSDQRMRGISCGFGRPDWHGDAISGREGPESTSLYVFTTVLK
ncbi:hypothetical protein C8F01DRAFT_1250481 [Mycena amicta]|nr:hypothetical protein C8F01DRAFT_1250481 [Mycena amicta]